MTYIIAYDITDNKIRRRIAKFLEGIAYRRQFSVFWAELKEREIEQVKDKVKNIIGDREECIFLIAPMCKICAEKIWMLGNPREEYKNVIIV